MDCTPLHMAVRQADQQSYTTGISSTAITRRRHREDSRQFWKEQQRLCAARNSKPPSLGIPRHGAEQRLSHFWKIHETNRTIGDAADRRRHRHHSQVQKQEMTKILPSSSRKEVNKQPKVLIQRLQKQTQTISLRMMRRKRRSSSC